MNLALTYHILGASIGSYPIDNCINWYDIEIKVCIRVMFDPHHYIVALNVYLMRIYVMRKIRIKEEFHKNIDIEGVEAMRALLNEIKIERVVIETLRKHLKIQGGNSVNHC